MQRCGLMSSEPTLKPKRKRTTDPLELLAKRRKAEDAGLRKQLQALDTQIASLKTRRDLVASLLGEGHDGGAEVVTLNNGAGETTFVSCADCGARVPGASAKNECPVCYAGPFEVAK